MMRLPIVPPTRSIYSIGLTNKTKQQEQKKTKTKGVLFLLSELIRRINFTERHVALIYFYFFYSTVYECLFGVTMYCRRLNLQL